MAPPIVLERYESLGSHPLHSLDAPHMTVSATQNLRNPLERQRRILFVAEAVTLAHVTRPLVLARSLDPADFETHFACAERFDFIYSDEHFQRWPLDSICSDRFLAAVSSGSPLFDQATLEAYVHEDLKLLDAIKPDVVVGDLRFSLSISARLRQVPYFSIINAYWSPYAKCRFPVPQHLLVQLFGVTFSNAVFQLLRPAIFTRHTRPLNGARRTYGLPPLRSLQEVYTDGDRTLYADIPDLVPTYNLPSHHHYLGPVLWPHACNAPRWWDSVPWGQPVVYVTLGSSGYVDVLPQVIRTLEQMPVSAIVATAGRAQLPEFRKNIFITDYLPGLEASARSALVICNGGSPTTMQALASGVPIVGIAGNMDQVLNMTYIEKAGAGTWLRPCEVTPRRLKRIVASLLDDEASRKCAQSLMQSIASYSAEARFRELVLQHLRPAAKTSKC